MNLKKVAIIITTVVLIVCGGYYQLAQPAQQGPSGHGQVYTIDTGHYSAEESKQAIPFHEREWANGSYSNTILNGPGEILIDLGEQLTVGAILTITPQGSENWIWNPANQSDNIVWYSNFIGQVSYSDWDTIIKEKIILYQPVRSIVWDINLSVKPQQNLQVSIDGTDYLIQSSLGSQEWIRIPMPFVTDATGANRTLRYSWNNGKRQLTLDLDDSGLMYPLTIDPVYTVDTTGTTGVAPVIKVNQTGYPWAAFVGAATLKVAYNNSGTWTVISTGSPSIGVAPSVDFDFDSSGIPIVFYLDGSSYPNITYYSGGIWNFVRCENAPGIGTTSHSLLIRNTTDNIVYTFYSNATANYLNVSYGSFDSLPPSMTPEPLKIGTAYLDTKIFSGAMNRSGIINIVYKDFSDSIGKAITYSTITKTVVGMAQVDSTISSNTWGLDVKINPVTQFPVVSHARYKSATKWQLNYSSFDGTNWNLEMAAQNVSGGSSAPAGNVALAINLTGFPYLPWRNGYASPYFMSLSNKTSGAWATVNIDTDTENYANPSATFDSVDNLHVVYQDATNFDLKYYYEPLATGGGAAPVAEFSCIPISAVRATLRTCTDSATNTPTSWDWYSDSGVECFSGNLTDQNPTFSPADMGYCDVCEIATNAYGTDTECKTQYLFTRKPVFS